MISTIPSAWKANLISGLPDQRDERLYIDFRGKDYPDISRDTRSYIDRGNCESETAPALRGETSVTTSDCTFARSSEWYRRGSYSYKLTKTVAAGTEAYVALQDGIGTSDMHCFLPGETVEFLLWLRVPSSGGPASSEITIRVQEYYSASWHSTTLATGSVAAGYKEKLAGKIALTDDTEAVRVEIAIASTAADTEYIYIDDIEIFRDCTTTLAREDNLIDRGNCESTTAPGILGDDGSHDCNPTRSDEFARSGDYSFRCAKSASGTDYWYLGAGNDTCTLFSSGETIEVECYVYCPTTGGISPDEFFIQIRDWDSGASILTQTDAYASGISDEFIRVFATHTFDESMVYGNVLLRVSDTAAAGEDWFIDDIRVTRHSVPGTHYLSGGYTEHLCELTDTGTIQIKFKPNFAYDDGDNWLLSWFVSGTQYLRLFYQDGTDQFQIQWYDGGTARSIYSAQYDDGTTHRNINQWITLTLSYDLTTGDTSGASLWMNKTQDDTTWGGNIDAKSTEFNKLQIRAYNGTIGDYDIAWVKYWPNYIATDADVQADMSTVYAEEIYFPMDGHATGKTRCLIPSTYVLGSFFEKGVANRMSGAYSTNTYSVSLKNDNGEFSDDQYAAFDPENAIYNGTIDQKYLQRRCRVWVEDWYDGDFDNLFFGRMTADGFGRQSPHSDFSRVSMSAMDNVERLHSARFKYGTYFEDALLCSSVTHNSLFHLISNKGNPRVRQYLANNSFEATTITDAWVQGSNTTLSRQTTNQLFGAAHGRIVVSGGAGETHAIVTFTSTETLSVGQSFTFSIWLLSSSAVAVTNGLKISEQDSGGENDSTAVNIALDGGEGMVKHTVTHTVTDSDSDRLYVYVYGDDGDTIDFDGAMLVPGDRDIDYFIESSLSLNEAASSGAVSADYHDEAYYPIFGFDAVDVSITHPWARADAEDRAWTHDKLLADSVAALYIGDDSNGTLRLRAYLEDGFTDKVPVGVISGSDFNPGINTNLTMAQANRIVGRGGKIVKQYQERFLWNAEASGAFELDSLGYLNEEVDNGDVFPDPDVFGDFYAQYDGVKGQHIEPEPDIIPTASTPEVRKRGNFMYEADRFFDQAGNFLGGLLAGSWWKR